MRIQTVAPDALVAVGTGRGALVTDYRGVSRMPLRRAYAPTLPEFDSFLFATVGEEVDGVPLSVLSALSRLGLDPREEAARLSHRI